MRTDGDGARIEGGMSSCAQFKILLMVSFFNCSVLVVLREEELEMRVLRYSWSAKLIEWNVEHIGGIVLCFPRIDSFIRNPAITNICFSQR